MGSKKSKNSNKGPRFSAADLLFDGNRWRLPNGKFAPKTLVARVIRYKRGTEQEKLERYKRRAQKRREYQHEYRKRIKERSYWKSVLLSVGYTENVKELQAVVSMSLFTGLVYSAKAARLQCSSRIAISDEVDADPYIATMQRLGWSVAENKVEDDWIEVEDSDTPILVTMSNTVFIKEVWAGDLYSAIQAESNPLPFEVAETLVITHLYITEYSQIVDGVPF